MPLKFDPSGSLLVVFRTPTDVKESHGTNFPEFEPVQTIGGPWSVAFDPKWGGKGSGTVRWADNSTRSSSEEGIRHYSGKAVYRKSFALATTDGRRMFLNLGRVKDMAEVRLNGRRLGVVWCPPWRIEITDAAPGTTTWK